MSLKAAAQPFSPQQDEDTEHKTAQRTSEKVPIKTLELSLTSFLKGSYRPPKKVLRAPASVLESTSTVPG